MKNYKKRCRILLILVMILYIVLSSVCPEVRVEAAASTTIKPAKVQGLRKTNVKTNSVAIKWNAAKNADGYEVFRDKKLVKRLKKLSYTDSKVAAGKKYQYTVRAYKNYKQKQYYNSKKKKWVTSKPKNSQWKGKKTRKVTKHRYGSWSKVLTVITKKPENPYAQKIPILAFHRIVSDECKNEYYADNQWVAAVSDFESQMKYLYDNNYKIISLQEFEDWYDGKKELPKKTAVLTFDDGDYELYYLAYPILKQYGFPATAFIVGSYTAEETSEYVENEKHRIGRDVINIVSEEYPQLQFQSHTYNLHTTTIEGLYAVETKTYEELDEDFKQNEEFGFEYIAYPYGKYTDDMINAAKNNGMRMGFAFSPYVCATRNDNRYAISRIKISGQISYEAFVKKMNSFL